ncbi:methyl-accepting chemotaxis protein [Bacillaceae bacterium S4-13-56]
MKREKAKFSFINPFQKRHYRMLGFKLNITFISLMIGVGLIFGGVSIPLISSEMQKTVEDQSLMTAETQMKSAENYINTVMEELELMAVLLGKYPLDEVADNYDRMRGANKKFSQSFYVGLKGKEELSTGYDTKLDDRSNEEVYNQAIKEEKYIGQVKHESNRFSQGANFQIDMSHHVTNIVNDSYGVIGVELQIDRVWKDLRGLPEYQKEEEVSSKKESEQSIYLVSKDGFIVASDNFNEVTEQLKGEGELIPSLKEHEGYQHLVKQMEKETKEERITDVGLFEDQDGNKQVMAYSYNPKLGMGVFVETPESVAFQSISDMISILIIVIGLGVIGATITSFIISRRITQPIKTLMGIAKEVSEGDLTKQTKIKQKDEIGELGNSFDDMVHSLNEIVKKTQKASSLTLETSREFKGTASEVAISTEQVTAAINEIAKGAEYQAITSQEIEDEIQLFLDLAKHLDKQNDDVMENAIGTQKVIQKNQEMIESLIRGVQELSEQASDSSEEVKLLESHAKEIGSIIGTTNDIANKTNLLALNASIEAARAGETGKGFAVVANEVKKLAEQSQESSSKIETIISDVLHSIQQVSKKMEKSAKKANGESESAQKAKEALQSIFASMNDVLQSVEKMDEYFEKQKGHVESIQNKTKEASSLAIETSSNVEEVTASSTQTEETMNDFVRRIQILLDMADDLKKTVERFKI